MPVLSDIVDEFDEIRYILELESVPGAVVTRNAITVDVEDWYHICGHECPQDMGNKAGRVVPATERILALLAEYGVSATFFMLGSMAESEPELAPRIVAGGHEIASHGWSHTLLHDLSQEQFIQELQRTEDIIVAQTGLRPIGFRAPQWSVSGQTPWVHDILADRNYLYDSSLTPLPFIGNREGSRIPYRIATANGALWEIPPLVTPTWFGNMPTGGGWGFRFFPTAMVSHTIRRLNATNNPGVIYLHPRDVDPDGPQLILPALKRFAAYGTKNDARPRVRTLLERFHFTTLKELVSNDLLHSDSCV